MSTRRVAWIVAIAAVIYAAATWYVLGRFEIPPLGVIGVGMVVLAAACQMTAKWCFGLLFREGVQEVGGHLDPVTAFKAALVGAGVARLIPAGGAITPVAMAWTVRRQSNGVAGAAVRATLLNYSGLLILSGAGLLLARSPQGVEIAQTTLMALAPFAIVVGLVLMFGTGKLGSVGRFLPSRLREFLGHTMIDHAPAIRSQLLTWGRLVLEGLALWLVMRAFGVEVTLGQAAAAFGVSQLAGGLPGLPGGLGLTEAGLVGVLAAYGYPAIETVAPVLIFRLVSYWLPAAAGLFVGGATFIRSQPVEAAA